MNELHPTIHDSPAGGGMAIQFALNQVKKQLQTRNQTTKKKEKKKKEKKKKETAFIFIPFRSESLRFVRTYLVLRVPVLRYRYSTYLRTS